MRSFTLLLPLVFLVVFESSLSADTILVPSQQPTIQAGIDAAVNGDTVLVADGTYTGAGNRDIDFHGKAIVVMSENVAENCIIDCEKAGRGFYFHNGESLSSVVQGFTITNGYVGWPEYGGGMYNYYSSPTVTYCTFTGNTTGRQGGGMCNEGNSSPTITNCTFSVNRADICGGGMANNAGSSPTVTYCTFSGNSAVGSGGGMINNVGSSPTVTYCTFSENWSNIGGGMQNDNSNTTVTNCTFSENTAAANGGGIRNGGSPTFTNCTFIGNSASISGGGGMFSTGGSPTFTNCTFIGNSASSPGGGGMLIGVDSMMTVTNCMFIGNSASSGGGGGMLNKSCSSTVTNCILWGNSAPEGKEISVGSSFYPATVTISYSDVEGGQSSCHVEPGCILNWGPGMIDADPLFADPGKDDFHLTYDSPCRNTGDSTAVTELFDFEGDPRIHDGTVDIGIDEFHPHLYQIGVVGLFSTFEVKIIGDPGTSPITLAQGSGIQDPPQSTPYGDLYLVLPPVKIFNLGAIPANGICVVSAKKPPGWQLGDSHPFQALAGPLGGSTSVLTNLMILTVE